MPVTKLKDKLAYCLLTESKTPDQCSHPVKVSTQATSVPLGGTGQRSQRKREHTLATAFTVQESRSLSSSIGETVATRAKSQLLPGSQTMGLQREKYAQEVRGKQITTLCKPKLKKELSEVKHRLVIRIQT